MRMFETPRKMQAKPTYQFHFELTTEEMDKLLVDYKNGHGSTSTHNIIKHLLVDSGYLTEEVIEPAMPDMSSGIKGVDLKNAMNLNDLSVLDLSIATNVTPASIQRDLLYASFWVPSQRARSYKRFFQNL